MVGRALPQNAIEPATLTVVLVDPERLIRHGVSQLIRRERAYEVVGEANDFEAALNLLQEKRPDILVTEIALPGRSGIELLHEIRRRNLPTKAVVLSRSSTPQCVMSAVSAGASAFIGKDAEVDELYAGLRASMIGEVYLCAHIQQSLPIEGFVGTKVASDFNDPLAVLSLREREIFHLLASGMRNASIARKLFISPRTVETHRARIVRKLGIRTNADLIRFAIRAGIALA